MSHPGISLLPLLPCLMLGLLLLGGSSAGDVTRATCVITQGSGIGNVSGTITLSQTDSTVTLKVNLSGFPLNASETKHGFHVHQSGNLSEKCNACGAHFNPGNVTHGDINDEHSKRHVGDLGNLVVLPNGTVSTTITDSYISLLSNSMNNIIGRGIVVHAMEDDLGKGNHSTSNATGNAGGRLGCCTVTLESRSPSLSALSTSLLLLSMMLCAEISL